MISTSDDLKDFLSKTFCFVQQGPSNLYEQTGWVLGQLHDMKLIIGSKRIPNSGVVTYEITPLGRATYKGGIREVYVLILTILPSKLTSH